MILINQNGIVVDVGPQIEKDGDYFVRGNIYYQADGLTLVDVEAPAEVIPQKYSYVDGEFAVNPDYVEPEAEQESEEPASD